MGIASGFSPQGSLLAPSGDGVTPGNVQATFVLRPSGALAPNEYTTWAALYADFALVSGPKWILIAENASVPAGAYLLGDAATIMSPTHTAVALTLDDGVTFDMFPIFSGALSVVSQSTGPIWVVSTPTHFMLCMNGVVFVSDSAVPGVAPAVQVQAGGVFIPVARGFCQFGDGTAEVFEYQAGSDGEFNLDLRSKLFANALVVNAAVVAPLRVSSDGSDAEISRDQPNAAQGSLDFASTFGQIDRHTPRVFDYVATNFAAGTVGQDVDDGVLLFTPAEGAGVDNQRTLRYFTTIPTDPVTGNWQLTVEIKVSGTDLAQPLAGIRIREAATNRTRVFGQMGSGAGAVIIAAAFTAPAVRAPVDDDLPAGGLLPVSRSVRWFRISRVLGGGAIPTLIYSASATGTDLSWFEVATETIGQPGDFFQTNPTSAFGLTLNNNGIYELAAIFSSVLVEAGP